MVQKRRVFVEKKKKKVHYTNIIKSFSQIRARHLIIILRNRFSLTLRCVEWRQQSLIVALRRQYEEIEDSLIFCLWKKEKMYKSHMAA